MGRAGKYCFEVIHNNILYINQILGLCILDMMGSIWDLKYISFLLKLIHHLYQMMQTTICLLLMLKIQNQQFQCRNPCHHKIQFLLDNWQGNCRQMSVKMSLSQQQQFEMSMYLENKNPQIKKIHSHTLYYINFKLMDMCYQEQCSLLKVLCKLQNLLLFIGWAIKSFLHNYKRMAHYYNISILVPIMNSKYQLSKKQ
ncbi:unnamed protein product [Paramecium primaurelia]|uniref:Transmembrane protein n=1 Tax=Paramecium primaurelia TaxID=5886 RepID=A0A8S1NW27_PARPR|nr:unnamed protein product [Paramecium primaurelia]